MNEHGCDELAFNDTKHAYRAVAERVRTQPANGKAAEPPAIYSPQWPDPLTQAAFYGIAGEYVRTVEPASETDTAALLLQFLVAAGNAIGHRPYYLAEDTPHYLNFYTVLIGLTSKSRKGTSWGRVKKLFAAVDAPWTSQCISSGLSSGEGLIEAVRDPSGDDDTGVADKRLLVCQGEFCGVLRVMERDGNTLSIVLRDAWDGVQLRTMTRKNNALRSNDSHVSMIGHITRDELRSALTETDKANGFANRILWACIGRSKELPDEVEINGAAWASITSRVKSAMDFARGVDRMRRSEDAKVIWRKVYHDLSEGQPGMFGAVTSRAEAQVVRLGDPVADAILAALKESAEGLTRTEISNLCGRNKSAARIATALGVLQERGFIASRKEQTDGRPLEVWFAIAGGTKETNETN
jgi:hypothetical protein